MSGVVFSAVVWRGICLERRDWPSCTGGRWVRIEHLLVFWAWCRLEVRNCAGGCGAGALVKESESSSGILEHARWNCTGSMEVSCLDAGWLDGLMAFRQASSSFWQFFVVAGSHQSRAYETPLASTRRLFRCIGACPCQWKALCV